MLLRIARCTARVALTLATGTLLVASAGSGSGQDLGSQGIHRTDGVPSVEATSAMSAVSGDGSIAIAAAILPGSRAVQVGTTAEAFATIMATGSGTATGCRIAPRAGTPATFAYQATDPATNAVIGMPNTPTNIAGGSRQTFVISLTPTAPFSSELVLLFDCRNTDPAPLILGVNTLLLTSTAGPTPDIVAVGATPTNDGIVTMFGGHGTGLFAVAASNLGAGGLITVSVDTGRARLPVSLSLCETSPLTGACLSSPAGAATIAIDAHATPTFTVFVQAVGTVPFDPTTNRVFVRFRTAIGATVGSTSAALQTL